MKIQFLGATQTVTGSKYLIKTNDIEILVDCGLFQGHKELRLRNWAPLPINPSSIKYVLLTHAHIDHSGYIPLLVKNGFRGKILCTEATKELARILLPDSGYLQEEEARYANKKGYAKHKPTLPLYTKKDAEIALSYFQTVPFDKPFMLHDGFYASFHYAGHILGASLIRLIHEETSILFSGDLGRLNDPLMKAPIDPPNSTYLVIESTYGDRLHDETDPEKQFGEIINRTAKRGGSILIPAFAVGRTQSILYYIHQLKLKNEIPDLPIFVDSPMATNASEIFYRHANLHRLTNEESAIVGKSATYVRSVEESIELTNKKMPMIIISASGMATGGRVLHHIRNLAPNYKNTILFSGFQAGGTRGDRIIRGEKEIKMFGQMIQIKAEVAQISNISAHADYKEILMWLSHLKTTPRKVFITHGEQSASDALKAKIEHEFNWNVEIPKYLDKYELT